MAPQIKLSSLDFGNDSNRTNRVCVSKYNFKDFSFQKKKEKKNEVSAMLIKFIISLYQVKYCNGSSYQMELPQTLQKLDPYLNAERFFFQR